MLIKRGQILIAASLLSLALTVSLPSSDVGTLHNATTASPLNFSKVPSGRQSRIQIAQSGNFGVCVARYQTVVCHPRCDNPQHPQDNTTFCENNCDQEAMETCAADPNFVPTPG